MLLRLPMIYLATIAVSFVVLIVLPMWQLFGKNAHDHRLDCTCKVEDCGLTTTKLDANLKGITIVREDECQTDLYPHGHWNRQGKELDTKWNSTGHRMLFGSLAAQHVIWRHQHPDPKNCRHKKFILYKSTGNGNGIGSVLHRTTILLQAALDLDRILLLYPQRNAQWIDGPFCIGTYTLDTCYFESLSSCNVRHALRRGQRWEDLPWLTPLTYGENREHVLKDDFHQFGAYFLIRKTPLIFHPMLREGNLSTGSYYWWRAQGVAYLVRPNVRTLMELERRRAAVFGNGIVEEGTVSVHVRHGDKWQEATLALDEAYLSTVEALVKENPNLKRNIFLSTEDANTVRFFQNVRNWTVQWTNVKRQSEFMGSTAQFAEMVGWNEEFLNDLLSLQLALECDAWVGMISSNWVRLIDELRSTIRCKHDSPFFDVFFGKNITDYDWR